jgi:putative oxidoreductase
MKIATIIVRVLLGLLFLFASVSYFLKLIPQPPMEGAMKAFNEGMAASGYILNVVKVLELVCGVALVVGRFVPLALVVLAPIVVNIFGVHLMLDRTGLPIALFVVAATLFLAYSYRDKYKSLFISK